ncbi:MAG: hypothetical protein AB7N76_17575 [Planctomycetota bacterium]
MADEQLRELERRWGASGSLEDQTALLRARARAGQLPRLRLAAYLGHELARELLSQPPTILPWRLETTANLVAGLYAYGAEACVRACLALAPLAPREPTAVWSRWDIPPALRGAARDAARSWARCPCEECPERAREVNGQVTAALAKAAEGRLWRGERAVCYRPEAFASRIAAAGEWSPRKGVETTDAARFVTETRDEAARSAVLAALVPWALGLSDPLA